MKSMFVQGSMGKKILKIQVRVCVMPDGDFQSLDPHTTVRFLQIWKCINLFTLLAILSSVLYVFPLQVNADH